ncbi:hypothetical protein Tco_1170705 [Tanacetum coccineum]
MWPKPGGLVYLLYVIKSPQSSMILPADHVSRAVISARLQLLNGFPGDPLPLIKAIMEEHRAKYGGLQMVHKETRREEWNQKIEEDKRREEWNQKIEEDKRREE